MMLVKGTTLIVFQLDLKKKEKKKRLVLYVKIKYHTTLFHSKKIIITKTQKHTPVALFVFGFFIFY